MAVPREGIIRGSASNVPGTGMEEIFLVLDPLVCYKLLSLEDAQARDLEILAQLKTGLKHRKRRITYQVLFHFSISGVNMGDHESMYPSFPTYMSCCPRSAHFAQFQVENLSNILPATNSGPDFLHSELCLRNEHQF